MFQLPETLPDEVLTAIHAAPKPNYPIITQDDLVKFDGFLFGLPTRYGTFPSQFSSFWDATGGLWATGALYGKYYGQFVSTGTPGGGQEVTIRNSMSSFAHHGLLYVPLGYKNSFAQLSSLDSVHGGSPWGAGAYAGADGSRQPSASEKEVAEIQGKSFGEILVRAHGGAAAHASTSESTGATTGTAAAAGGAAGAAATSSSGAPASGNAATGAVNKATNTATGAANTATGAASGAAHTASGAATGAVNTAAGAASGAAGAVTGAAGRSSQPTENEKPKSGSKCCIVM
ncbi:Pst2p [Sugiyamaella lignohabitans]|uniref:Pst2p n=1 Tax=Sugiyamaella lignohabitans TaxID=796027 RepID=A0A167G009_9ASCO|nr:Pst2p [Sugiyamaella lignohabitans]ANB15923.1 Pst2p [Sugiyamaella lignohabitans]